MHRCCHLHPQWLEDHGGVDDDEPLDVANFMHWTYISRFREEAAAALHDANASTTSALEGASHVPVLPACIHVNDRSTYIHVDKYTYT
jgi:hypothetical protein